jgi:hypothetical protein
MRRAFGLRRLAVTGLLTIAFVAGSVGAAPAASADPDIPFETTSSATIHLAKLGLDSTATSTISGTVDLATGDITGELDLGTTETSVDLFGLTAATIGVAIEPTAPLQAHLDFTTLEITASASFDIDIAYVPPLGIERLNLVGDRCTAREPITIEITGTVDLATFAFDASGEFEIPRFKSCGLFTGLINLLVAGPGNTFTSGPPPAAAA